MKKVLLICAILGMISVLGCSSAPSTSTTSAPPPTTTSAPPATTPTATTSSATFQTLASAGQATYASTCAVCHGDNGQGTSVCSVVMWGTGATLGTYNGVTLFSDAQGMLKYMSSNMPLTSPGSLNHQQYTELLAYILIQGNKVAPSTTFDENGLGSISIK